VPRWAEPVHARASGPISGDVSEVNPATSTAAPMSNAGGERPESTSPDERRGVCPLSRLRQIRGGGWALLL